MNLEDIGFYLILKPSSPHQYFQDQSSLKGTPIPSVWQGNKPPEVAARLREAAQMMQDRYALVLYNVMLPLLSSHQAGRHRES